MQIHGLSDARLIDFLSKSPVKNLDTILDVLTYLDGQWIQEGPSFKQIRDNPDLQMIHRACAVRDGHRRVRHGLSDVVRQGVSVDHATTRRLTASDAKHIAAAARNAMRGLLLVRQDCSLFRQNFYGPEGALQIAR